MLPNARGMIHIHSHMLACWYDRTVYTTRTLWCRYSRVVMWVSECVHQGRAKKWEIDKRSRREDSHYTLWLTLWASVCVHRPIAWARALPLIWRLLVLARRQRHQDRESRTFLIHALPLSFTQYSPLSSCAFWWSNVTLYFEKKSLIVLCHHH